MSGDPGREVARDRGEPGVGERVEVERAKHDRVREGLVLVRPAALPDSATSPCTTPVVRPPSSVSDTVAVPSHRVHEVCNLGPTDAVSIHVYSPRLTAMTFFDHRDERFLTPLRTERSDLHQLKADAA